MPITRLQALVRVLIFYFVALILLLFVGSVLQVSLGLTGVVLSQLLIFAALPLFFAGSVEKKGAKPFLRLRMITAGGIVRAVLLGAVGWLAAQLMGGAIIQVVQLLGGEMVQPYQVLLDAQSWAALLVGALVPALCEELSFRGYVLGALRPLGSAAAVVITGLLFGALHLSLIRLLPLSLLGMLWALAVQRSGSVLPGMIGHLLNNGIALGLTFLVQGYTNPAEAEALDAIATGTGWGAVAFVSLFSLGLWVVAYFLASGFGPRDLVRPSELEAEWDWYKDERPVPAFDPATESAELQRLGAELAALQSRRRRLLQGLAALLSVVILCIYVWAALQEWGAVFA